MQKGNSLPVSEMFYSLQGEGVTSGIPSFFLRLMGCNLMCGGYGTQRTGELYGATWRCDTIEVWTKGTRKTFDEILAGFTPFHIIERLRDGAHLIVTGGEPFLNQAEVQNFFQYLAGKIGKYPVIEIETNGTIAPLPELLVTVSRFNVSPKLANSGMPIEKRINETALKSLAAHRGTSFKFVISSPANWQEILTDFIEPGLIRREQVVLMPAGENQEQLAITRPVVADICKLHTIRFTDRLHVSVWDKKVGV